MGYCFTRDSALFALADGMGGHPEGEMAAQIALQTLASRFQTLAQPRIDDPIVFLREGVAEAHQQLLNYAQERKLGDTPRTTIVACVTQGGQAYWAHCGDSRLYWVRAGELLARTRDHSYSELQEALGRNVDRVNRNVLFTCLGSPGRPMVDQQGPLPLLAGDRILLCSDGLWGQVDEEEIRAVVIENSPQDACDTLVKMANSRGGIDNITAIILKLPK